MSHRSYLVPFSGKDEDFELMKKTMLSMLDSRQRSLGTVRGPADKSVLSLSAIITSLKSLASFFF